MTLSGNYVGADPPDPVLVAPVAAVERVRGLEARVATLEAALERAGRTLDDIAPYYLRELSQEADDWLARERDAIRSVLEGRAA